MDTTTSSLTDDPSTTSTASGASAGDPSESESEEARRLRADIAMTREQIGSTLGALQQKLSPTALAEQAKTVVRDATIGKVETMVHDAEYKIARTGYSFVDTIRDNPIPAALAGIGLAWLFMNRQTGGEYTRDFERVRGRRSSRDYSGAYSRDFSGDLGDVGRRGEGTVGERAQEAGQALSEKAHDAGQAISDKAQQAGHAISDKAQQAGQAISAKAHEAGQAVRHYAEEVGERSRALETRAEQIYRDNPIAVGAVVLAAGTAIGLAIPISRKEDEWMGRARDEVMEKAKGLAHETLEKVESAAKEAGHAANLAGDVTEKADRALQQAR